MRLWEKDPTEKLRIKLRSSDIRSQISRLENEAAELTNEAGQVEFLSSQVIELQESALGYRNILAELLIEATDILGDCEFAGLGAKDPIERHSLDDHIKNLSEQLNRYKVELRNADQGSKNLNIKTEQ
jgi:hypothetical protein